MICFSAYSKQIFLGETKFVLLLLINIISFFKKMFRNVTVTRTLVLKTAQYYMNPVYK